MSPFSAMEEDEACNAGLSLGLGMGGYVAKKDQKQKQSKVVANCLDLMAFELCPKGEAIKVVDEEFSLDQKNGCRKKLRLSKEQSALLEDSFNLHTTLNPAQKQALAEQLNLKPRQVEVWFQNRRARTKVKQTEVDCEFLKKCCENLTDENRRLKRELQELRALKVGPSPLYIQLSKAATLTLCSSCEKIMKPAETTNNNNNNAAISDMMRNKSHKLQSGLDLEGTD